MPFKKFDRDYSPNKIIISILIIAVGIGIGLVLWALVRKPSDPNTRFNKNPAKGSYVSFEDRINILSTHEWQVTELFTINSETADLKRFLRFLAIGDYAISNLTGKINSEDAVVKRQDVNDRIVLAIQKSDHSAIGAGEQSFEISYNIKFNEDKLPSYDVFGGYIRLPLPVFNLVVKVPPKTPYELKSAYYESNGLEPAGTIIPRLRELAQLDLQNLPAYSHLVVKLVAP